MRAWARIAIAVAGLTAFVGAQLAPAAWLPAAPGTDKQWHSVLYFGFALLLWWLLPARPALRAFVILVLGFLAGVLMEILQDLVPGRNPDQADAVADMVGLAAACVACWLGAVTGPAGPDEHGGTG